jgi:maleylacetate reductase
MQSFTYTAHPARVVFGAGAIGQVVAEVERLGALRALILCTPEQDALARDVAGRLGALARGVFAGAVMHVPVDAAERAREEARRLGADCVVCVGGGSTIGLGKAVALTLALPIVAVPTTYAGSEMTPIWGLTEGGVKTTGRDARVLPRSVIYDPELTLTLPLALSVQSALCAMAHAAEGLYAHDGNPITALLAEEGLRASAGALGPLLENPRDLAARGDALYGAWLCGTVLGAVSMGLHHKLCHTLGGSFNLPHAEVHSVILPHALAYNASAAPEAMARIARALGCDDPCRGIFELARWLGAPSSLQAIGMPEQGLDRAADLAVKNQYPNPRPLDRGAISSLLRRAFDGEPPRA